MTTQAGPDPTTLNSWEEAFQYPLPTVRRLSTRLRKDVDEHRARLRSLVGASYRDLLGTAERIVDMDKQIQSVETVLSDVGRRCNSNLLERSDANFLGLEKSLSETHGQDIKLRRAALLRILSATLNVVSRLVKKHGNALQASKLMILARLLYKSLSDEEDTLVVLEKHRRTISSLRNRLLVYIDRSLGRQETTADEITAALSAFAMLTSSTPRDVLRHFLAIRAAQLESITETSTSEAILKALDLHSATFITVQSLFPKRIAESLSSLAKVTLLSDQHIKTVDELNLDVFGRWVPSDVRSFTPWVQQEALSANDGRQALLNYGTQARAVLLAGVRACLESIEDADAVLEIRKKVLGAYLTIGKQIRIAQFAQQIDELRDVFVSRMRSIAATVSRLDSLFSQGRITITSNHDSSIWELAAQDIDLSAGASQFRKKIVRYHRGHSTDFDTAIDPLTQWAERIDKYWQSVQVMRATKWNEYLETDLEDNEEEEDEQSYQDQLSLDDPDDVISHLRETASTALTKAFDRLEKSTGAGQTQAPAYIRLLRELNRQHRHVGELIGVAQPEMLERQALSSRLHVQLATSAVSYTIDEFARALSRRQYVPLDLWDGSPSLPSQPLPASFRFIMTLQQNMAAVGNDVWSPAAVIALKTVVIEKLPSILQSPFEEGKAVNGDTHVNGAATAVSADDSSEKTSVDKNDGEQHVDASEKNDGPAVLVGEEAADTATGQPQEQPDKPADPSEATGDKDSKQNGDGQPSDTPAHLQDHLQYTQRLFDAYWLRCVLQSNKDGGKLDAAIDVLKDSSMLEGGAQQRLEKNAVEYWRKTYLLFALLTSSNDVNRK